jgi:hypothetical protein
MGPELALPVTFAATLSREAACRREEPTTATAPSDLDAGAKSKGFDVSDASTPGEVA